VAISEYYVHYFGLKNIAKQHIPEITSSTYYCKKKKTNSLYYGKKQNCNIKFCYNVEDNCFNSGTSLYVKCYFLGFKYVIIEV